MNQFLFILLSVLTLGIKTSIENTFIEEIDKNYDYYQIVYEKKTNALKSVAVIGLVNDKWSYSIFFEQFSNHNYQIKTTINNQTKLLTTSTNYGMYFDIDVKENAFIDVAIIEQKGGDRYDNFEIKIPAQIDNFKNNENTIKGQGLNQFPSSSKGGFNLKMAFIYIMIGLIILSLIFLYIILYVMKKQNSKLNSNNHHKNIMEPDYEIIDNINEIPQQKSKQEIMDDFFKDFREGKITESQLNSALRALWWEEDD